MAPSYWPLPKFSCTSAEIGRTITKGVSPRRDLFPNDRALCRAVGIDYTSAKVSAIYPKSPENVYV